MDNIRKALQYIQFCTSSFLPEFGIMQFEVGCDFTFDHSPQSYMFREEKQVEQYITCPQREGQMRQAE